MQINIQSIDFRFSQQLYNKLQKKLQKFTRLCGDIISADVRLTYAKAQSTVNKACGIRLVIPGYDMVSNAQSNSFEEAIAKAVEGLERQIEKRKGKSRQQLMLIPVQIYK